ncbi:hypothetical protein QL285_032531 [Trifolium repens]|nr:hypothetical protein QL285_032531 [Trifolium repens]
MSLTIRPHLHGLRILFSSLVERINLKQTYPAISSSSIVTSFFPSSVSSSIASSSSSDESDGNSQSKFPLPPVPPIIIILNEGITLFPPLRPAPLAVGPFGDLSTCEICRSHSVVVFFPGYS